jgi:hypothetical protein
LNSATNTYLVFITFAFTFTAGLLNWLIDPIKILLSKDFTLIQYIFIISMGLAILLIVLSLIFTILVVKVHKFERLCIPKDFALEMSNVNEESEILTSITSHHIVATERNHMVNNRKAKLLSFGLQAYISGFILFILSVITLLLANELMP